MDLGFSEMFFIVVLALLLFGPRKLPEIGRQIGKALAEFKRAKNEFTSQIEDEVRRLEQEERAKKTAPALLPMEEDRVQPADTAARGTLLSGEPASPSSSGPEFSKFEPEYGIAAHESEAVNPEALAGNLEIRSANDAVLRGVSPASVASNGTSGATMAKLADVPTVDPDPEAPSNHG